jgi:hypothetical protein
MLNSFQEVYSVDYHYSATGKMDEDGIFMDWTVIREWYTLKRKEIEGLDYIMVGGRKEYFSGNPVSPLIYGIPPIPTIGSLQAYGAAARLTAGHKGLYQAHKLIEWRILRPLGISKSRVPAVILSKKGHQEITKILRTGMKYGTYHSIDDALIYYQNVYPKSWVDYLREFIKEL